MNWVIAPLKIQFATAAQKKIIFYYINVQMKSTIFLFLSMSIVGLYAQDTIKVNSDMPIQAAQKNYNAGLMELKNNNFLVR